MGSPPRRAVEREPIAYAPSKDDADLFVGPDEPVDVDAQAHLAWLETGEGEPWPARSS